MALELRAFGAIDLEDPFFDSLKQDYKEFVDWFAKKAKASESAYIFSGDSGLLDGFLYLKTETGAVDDVVPPLPARLRIKVGTMKINPHGTRLGERFIKKIFDHALAKKVDEIYVTVFDHHAKLVELFARYGFKAVASKTTSNGIESVMVRNLREPYDNVLSSYPLVSLSGHRIFQLAIDPKWHTRLLPDSILNNEPDSVVRDVSHSNSIHKVYLAAMRGMDALKRGDVILIYRTGDGQGAARFRAVATSVCVVEEYRPLGGFSDEQEFLSYCRPYSVFTDAELHDLWLTRRYPHVIRFTYNFALNKRVTRGAMIDIAGVDENAYAGFLELSREQLLKIIELGAADESLVVN